MKNLSKILKALVITSLFGLALNSYADDEYCPTVNCSGGSQNPQCTANGTRIWQISYIKGPFDSGTTVFTGTEIDTQNNIINCDYVNLDSRGVTSNGHVIFYQDGNFYPDYTAAGNLWGSASGTYGCKPSVSISDFNITKCPFSTVN